MYNDQMYMINSFIKVILPHSKITLEKNDCEGFNNSKSSTTSLNHPSYFIYDIDRELKMIKSSDLTAHLHLCYSHIVTSSLFRDPFTGLRGMELGVILLKKFNNNMPLNQSQLNILSAISNISPKRTQSNHIQQITISFPLLAPMISHYDGFVILVDMIKQSHAEMSILWISNQKATPLTSTLNRIAWNRYKRIYSPLCQIDGPIDTSGSFIVIEPPAFGQNTKNVQRMASIIESKNIKYLDNSFNPYSMIGTSTIHGLDFTDRKNCVPEFQETPNLIHTYQIRSNQGLADAFATWYLKLLKIAMETASETLVNNSVPSPHYFIGYTEKEREKKKREITQAKADILNRIFTQNIWEMVGAEIIAPTHTSYTPISNPYLQYNQASFNETVKGKIIHWYNNRRLKLFLESIQNQLQGKILFDKNLPQEYQMIWHVGFDKQLESIWSTLGFTGTKSEKISFDKMDDFIYGIYHKTNLEEELFDDLNISKDSLKNHLYIQLKFGIFNSQTLGRDLEKLSVIIQQKIDLVWKIIQQFYKNPKRTDQSQQELDCIYEYIDSNIDFRLDYLTDCIFKSCHSWIGCVPLTVYEDFSNYLIDLPDQIYQLIGVHILLQGYKQKIQKCKVLKGVDLVKELSQSRETRQWLPKDYPTWLVFELEQSIWIRDTQAEIAEKLINAQSNECVQLQMGEGKTSVILPIMCLAISNGNRIARVNAIPSLLQTYIQDLQMRLGSSILNRPIHLYPFKRDIGPSISVSHVRSILGNIEKCNTTNSYQLLKRFYLN
ncbi:hypothetical protein DFA_00084 [Cavenderia fasciculata]|uniref:ubiquitinyl hydrolase 1 n=1 Tax=Cavenderia fasciculata TaxID=261658 RepID=F4PXJ6_CACFS|nr:uncharacterized protein DFA_00084 [Cavenderia fasciculata]EGG19506.1 hypothetical protein DFA_00084 [Cavenderia fasciculata]|eukprot:XP_004357800.1 hypothetical protein DFA_00084 [Cavenderia fasciculata]